MESARGLWWVLGVVLLVGGCATPEPIPMLTDLPGVLPDVNARPIDGGHGNAPDVVMALPRSDGPDTFDRRDGIGDARRDGGPRDGLRDGGTRDGGARDGAGERRPEGGPG